MNRPPGRQQGTRPKAPSRDVSYRPPRGDLDKLRAEQNTSSAPDTMEQFQQYRAEQGEQAPGSVPGRDTPAGDPLTEGHRVTVEIPPIPEATEGPSAAVPPEGAPSTTGPQPIAGSVQRRRAALASRRSNPLRHRLLQALSTRRGIRDAFVFQAVIGQPKGLLSEDQSIEGS